MPSPVRGGIDFHGSLLHLDSSDSTPVPRRVIRIERAWPSPHQIFLIHLEGFPHLVGHGNLGPAGEAVHAAWLCSFGALAASLALTRCGAIADLVGGGGESRK